MKFKNETYDKLKWIVQVFLPALLVFLGVIGQSVGWHQTDLAMTLLSGFTVFLGTLLGLSNNQYRKEETK